MEGHSLDWEDVPAFMNDLRGMARRLLSKERNAGSLQTTALVLSALRRQKLSDQDWGSVTWENRAAFLAAAYRAMTRALIEHARRRRRELARPAADVLPEDLEFEDLPAAVEQRPLEVEALAHALERLAVQHPEWAQLVQHRYYAGYTLEEAARVMDLSEKTLRRWWMRARVLLLDEVLRYLHDRV